MKRLCSLDITSLGPYVTLYPENVGLIIISAAKLRILLPYYEANKILYIFRRRRHKLEPEIYTILIISAAKLRIYIYKRIFFLYGHGLFFLCSSFRLSAVCSAAAAASDCSAVSCVSGIYGIYYILPSCKSAYVYYNSMYFY